MTCPQIAHTPAGLLKVRVDGQWVDFPERWSVSCCTDLAAAWPGTCEPWPTPIYVGTEAAAIDLLAAHVAEWHGIAVVRTVTIIDENPCHGPARGPGVCVAPVAACPPCGGTGVTRTLREITITDDRSVA